MSEWTTSVSAALHTLGRWIFALTAIFTAMSTSASASTYTWQLPAAAYITGHRRVLLERVLQPLAAARDDEVDEPVRRCDLAQLVAVATRHRRDRARPAGPPPRPPRRRHRASAAFECAAIDDPRSTIALPDLMQSAEQSIVTFGRAS